MHLRYGLTQLVVGIAPCDCEFDEESVATDVLADLQPLVRLAISDGQPIGQLADVSESLAEEVSASDDQMLRLRRLLHIINLSLVA